ncbi:Lariat debranching enzyme [Penicillium macrosclerotiorum]|uniref:Lariat debranching enzyme n=1 Tax=Penicillium macrosclerotiorum TaxID=303699 RepID=UPI002548FA6A|nr:Lariat debranching enzyme [Penicillium macrosclerotiorum]KAJ5690747.1 Lariat debranching enzyme [Penicillium macrosclerotiorum]
MSEIDGIRVVTVGCGHGSLGLIYDQVDKVAVEQGWDTVDCVIIGGDFQALRNANDAACISVPAKWKKMGDFKDYYEGQRVAPYLTIFCGGNHEASNFLFELYYGGWVATNIYYLGAANVIRLGDLRISGMSGIWKGYDYRKPHFERLPYNHDDLHSIYHLRELDVRKLLQIRTQIDVGLSHDWPRGIEYSGNFNQLFARKRGFREDSEHGRLGNVAAREVLDRLRPPYWFSAHLHVKFAAAMAHDGVSLRKVDGLNQQIPTWSVEIDPESIPSGSGLSLDPSRSPPPEFTTNEIRFAEGAQEDRTSAWQYFASGAAHQTEQKHFKAENKAFVEMLHNMKDPPTTNAPETSPTGGDVLTATNNDEINLDSDSDSDKGSPSNTTTPVKPPKAAKTEAMVLDGANDIKTPEKPLIEEALPDSLRTKLPASFARGPTSIRTSSTPSNNRRKKIIPEAITNKLTKFLALDKPCNRDDYVQPMMIKPLSSQGDATIKGPLRLSYDKEWLAITRVFASDLVLGDPAAEVPPDLGEASYLARILEEEAWVEENIVQRGLMEIPHNFQCSAPKFDPNVDPASSDQPKEYSNIQTSEFCELLQIENKFDIPDSERLARMTAGPRHDGPGFSSRGGRGGAGRGSGRGGRGGRSGRGGRGGRRY